MPRELQRAFLAMLPGFITALSADPPSFPPNLRLKRVQGADGVWEITFAPDGGATFAYGPEVRSGASARVSLSQSSARRLVK